MFIIFGVFEVHCPQWINGDPLSLGPISSGRLKKLKDVDKWSSLSLYLPVRGMSVACELGLYLYSRIS